jgi:transketolase
MKKVFDTKALAKAIRKHAIEMTHRGNSSHIGSVLSIADILAVLYGKVMQYDVVNPRWEQRDRFILSKGHAGAGVYAVLAEVGFFPAEQLIQHYQNGSFFSGHVSHKGIPGVEVSTGSLGHGLSIGTGMAYAGKLKNANHKVYVLLSDGECGEGSNWEAILFSGHHQLNNLVVIIDYNKLQSLDTVENTLSLEPFADKWRSFNWNVTEINGHHHEELLHAFTAIYDNDKPHCIIAHTVKGKGVSFMENKVAWHYRSPQDDNYRIALTEVDLMT